MIEHGQDPKGKHEDTTPGQDDDASKDLQGGPEGGRTSGGLR